MRVPLTLKLMFSYIVMLLLCALPVLTGWHLRIGIALGIAASAALLFGLLILTQLSLPLLRVQRDLLGLGRGEYNPPPAKPLRDEIGDVQAALTTLGRTLQRERVLHSADDAVRAELVRVVPLPLLVLTPALGLRHVNAAFREYAGLDPATEMVRLHAICQSGDFAAALVLGRQGREPVPLVLSVPWRRDLLRLRLCPLPAPAGEVGWALLGDVTLGSASFVGRGDWSGAQGAALVAAHEILSRLSAQCTQGPAVPAAGGDVGEAAALWQRTLRARVVELKAALAAAEPEELPEPRAIGPVELLPLLEDVMAEVSPVALEASVHLDLDAADLCGRGAMVADSGLRLRRALRSALLRGIGAARQARGEGMLLVSVLADGGVEAPLLGAEGMPARAPVSGLALVPLIRVRLSGMRTRPYYYDLERILSPLGGGAGWTDGSQDGVHSADNEEAPPEAPAEAPIRPDGEELWLWLRRA